MSVKIRILSGRFGGRYILTPNRKETRVATARFRKMLFDILMPYLEDSLVLDLFAGSGSLGFEALSRGASFVTFIDRDKKPIETLKKNVALLKVEKETEVLQKEAFTFLKSLGSRVFDLVFLDPPYDIGDDIYRSLALFFDANPDYLTEKAFLSVELPAKSQACLKEISFKHLKLWKERSSSTTALLIFRKI